MGRRPLPKTTKCKAGGHGPLPNVDVASRGKAQEWAIMQYYADQGPDVCWSQGGTHATHTLVEGLKQTHGDTALPKLVQKALIK